MKCDLHVHSVHSGMCSTPLANRFCRESYNDPNEVYAQLKKRGMGLVTLTDHDSIDGAESLRCHPDFFLSEEVTCRMPSGTTIHIGVYDLTERQHIEIQRRREDLPCLLAYLTERRLLFSVKHVFSSLTGPRDRRDFSWFENYFPAVEALNGQMLPFHNRRAESFARRLGKISVGGSDSHALLSVGSAYTEVPGARGKFEFFQGVRAGQAIVRGENGNYFKLTRDVLWITAKMMEEDPWKMLFTPLVILLPLATLTTMFHEMAFARHWTAQLETLPAENDIYRGLGGASAQGIEEVFAWP